MENNLKYIYIYIYVCVELNRFAVHRKLTQYCNSTIFQLKKECPLRVTKYCRHREKRSGQSSSSCRHPEGYVKDGSPVPLAET